MIKPDGVLYKDNLISVTQAAIKFKWYYFWGNKTVLFTSIDSIQSLEPTVLNGKWRIWGTSGPGGWMPLDWHRPSRGRIFLLRYKNKKFMIAFTAENGAMAESTFKKLNLAK